MCFERNQGLGDLGTWYDPRTWFSSESGVSSSNPNDYPEPEIGPITPYEDEESPIDSEESGDENIESVAQSSPSHVVKVPTAPKSNISISQTASGMSSMILPVAIIGGGLLAGYLYMKSKQQQIIPQTA